MGTSRYKLDLLASITIHNTLHISLLEPYEDNKFPSLIQTPPPPIEREGEPRIGTRRNHRLALALRQTSVPRQVDWLLFRT